MLATPTAAEIIEKSAALVHSSKPITVKFSIATSKGNSDGEIISMGNKFFINMSGGKIWYDGRTMTSYNPSAKEATTAIPSASELREVNPFYYLKGWHKLYTVSLAKSDQKKKYIVILSPKNKNSEARKAVLSVDSRNFKPLKLVINIKSGEVITITVKEITSAGEKNASGFKFPASKYPNTEIIDLTR